ncbi:MAG: hypothetical protein PUK18_02140 [Firmicutes bacterium]|nr:hypothetical protein [Bacillota bacterium]MDY6160402.1 hypothetical protein [Candidatus Faecousia sp.]
MNSKAIKRQLLAAIAMVLVAALALGSSTYAWFVQAGSVTAEGLHVNVKATGGLLIKFNGANDQWGVTATAHMESDENMANLKPVSTHNLVNWATADAAQPGSFERNDDTYKAVTVTKNAKGTDLQAGTEYVIMKQFAIRAANATDVMGLKVSDVKITKTAGGTDNVEQQLNSSLRVALEYKVGSAGTFTKYISAPVTTADRKGATSYNVYEVNTSGKGANTSADTTHAMPFNQLLNYEMIDINTPVPTTDEEAVIVNVYIWFEGQDPALFTNNVLADEDVNISIEFSCLAGGNATNA